MRLFKSTQILLLLPVLILALAACSGPSDSTPAANPDSAVENLTGKAALFVENGCIACHAIEASPNEGIGPPMDEIATRSAKTIQEAAYTGKAETVQGYIRESILNPNIYIVDDYMPVMPKTYRASLTEQEVTDLVDFLLTLE